MLEEVLNHIRNRFDYKFVLGTFVVSEGGLSVEDLQEDQYFWITGSVFNDGLHKYPATDLKDETFEGKIRFLAIPNAVIELADEIEQWCSDNAELSNSPFQSESFDGYSYSKEGGQSGEAGGSMSSWQGHFASRLNVWRKVNW